MSGLLGDETGANVGLVQRRTTGAARRPARATTRVTTAERTSSPATNIRPPVKLPVRSLIQPIAHGPTKPPRLPIALMVAMPTAAAEPDRNMVGIAQSGGFAALMPTLTRLSAATTAITEV